MYWKIVVLIGFSVEVKAGLMKFDWLRGCEELVAIKQNYKPVLKLQEFKVDRRYHAL